MVSAESLNLIFESLNQGQLRPYLQASTPMSLVLDAVR